MSELQQFEIRYANLEALSDANARELKHGGGFVISDDRPALFTRVRVVLCLPDGPSVDVPGRIVNHSGAGFFVQFEQGIEYEALKSAIEFVTEMSSAGLTVPRAVTSQPVTTPPPQATPPIVGEFTVSPSEPALTPPASPGPAVVRAMADASQAAPVRSMGRAAWELIDLTGPVPLAEQVDALSVAEKRQLARYATRPVRRILVQQPDPVVQSEVVRNPKVSQAEIQEYASLAISADALAWIATQRRYTRVPEVVYSLVTNPATPTDTALALLTRVPVAGLLDVYRAPDAPLAVRDEVKRRLSAP